MVPGHDSPFPVRPLIAVHATIGLMNQLMKRRKPLPLLILSLSLLAGCAPPPAQQAASAPGADMAAWYRANAAREPVYRIDPGASLIAVTVRRGGPFARFGHDHVVASRTLDGYAAPRSGRADLRFRLDQLSVDEKPLRDAAGLDTNPSADAIEGTRANMLNKVLEAERFPLVLLRVEKAGAAGALRLFVTLHGVTRSYEVPAKVEITPAALTASGTLQLLQSDFGITPMSIMGGALSVQDALDMRFTIVARPTGKG
jgi:hypothetical protein